MGILAAIGMLSILGGLIYLYLQHLSTKENKNNEKSRLIAKNDRCQNLIYEYNSSIRKGRPIMTHRELTKKLHKILDDPLEVEKAISKIEQEENFQKQFDQDRRKERKVGYKYEIEIFEIFDIRKYLSKEEILTGIRLKFNSDKNRANEIFEIWRSNNLITQFEKNNLWQVGAILTVEYFNLDKDDWTRIKWLVHQGKSLEEIKKCL